MKGLRNAQQLFLPIITQLFLKTVLSQNHLVKTRLLGKKQSPFLRNGDCFLLQTTPPIEK